ncbi:PRC-barrel domain-containing protein [Paracoccus sp. WLY502]|uniref:PRC-barrel domain-containing protein n=1 Tax=Paracoccus yibinensis TaxID=3068891 RepID=UPI00279676BA|nr:PRC-barrel domain-containing protein [Paracoccus sp. WLY502]MDQ1899273.1 PRC-barrel domain-containing protein [Paracoccus sp. WLY502]
MRKLMLGTAMILPLMMGPAFAQDTATTPAPAEPATDAATAPMGAETAPAAEVPAGENTEAAADAAAEADVAASGKVEQQQAENELRIDWITDATVNSPDGEAIGEINDVIVDAEAGTMKAAVIGVGGFLGIGEKQIAVPWDQLEINYDAQQITSDLTQEEAEAAPEYVFREQEAAPDAAGGTGMGTDSTMTATPDSSATTAPAATTTDPAMTGTDAATTTTTEPMEAPADTAETPATPPADAAMEPEDDAAADMEPADDAAAEPAEGTAPATN